jgi:hypothetical protein
VRLSEERFQTAPTEPPVHLVHGDARELPFQRLGNGDAAQLRERIQERVLNDVFRLRAIGMSPASRRCTGSKASRRSSAISTSPPPRRSRVFRGCPDFRTSAAIS